MDLTIAICIAVVLASVLIMLTIVKLTYREKSYEEIIAEREKQFALIKAESPLKGKQGKKERKHEKKKKGKSGSSFPKSRFADLVVDEPMPSDEGEDSIQCKKMVELEIDPEIIQVKEVKENPSENLRKRNKDKSSKSNFSKQKSILINKEEHSYRTTKDETKETFHPQSLPKDEIELQHGHQSDNKLRQKASMVSANGKKSHSTKSEKVESVSIAGDSSSTGHQIKVIESLDSSCDLIREHIYNSDLSNSDVESLIELLLSKPTGSLSKKMHLNYEVAALKQELNNKGKELSQEIKHSQNANRELEKVRKLLSSEKDRIVSLEKSSSSKVSELQKEKQTLQGTLQSVHEKHQTDMTTLQSVLQQMSEENSKLKSAVNNVQPSTPDVVSLQQSVHFMQQDLKAKNMQITAIEQAKTHLEQQLDKFREQMQQKDGNHMENMKQLKEELLHSHSVSQTSDKKVRELQGNLTQVNSNVISLQKKIADVEQANLHKDQEITSLINRNKEQQKSLEVLNNENSELLEQVKNKAKTDSMEERYSTDRFIETEQKLKSSEVQLEEKQKAIEILENQLQEQKDKNNVASSQIESSNCQLEQLKNENKNLNNDVKKHTQKIADLTKINQENETKIQSLSTSNKEASVTGVEEEEYRKLNNRINELEQLLEERNNQVDTINRQRNKDDQNCQELVEKLEILKSELSSREQEVDKLLEGRKLDRDENKKLLDNLQCQLTESEKKLQSEQEKSKLNELKAQDVSQMLVKLEADVASETVQLKEGSNAMNDLLQQKTDALEQFKQQTLEEQEQLKKHVTELTESLSNKNKELEKLNIEVNLNYDRAQNTSIAMDQIKKEIQMLKEDVKLKESHIKTLEDQLNSGKELKQATAVTTETPATVNSIKQNEELENANKQIAKLQVEIEHYQSVLTETEVILKKLEKSVECEDTKWKEDIEKAKDRALQAEKRVKQLEAKLELYQSNTDVDKEMINGNVGSKQCISPEST